MPWAIFSLCPSLEIPFCWSQLLDLHQTTKKQTSFWIDGSTHPIYWNWCISSNFITETFAIQASISVHQAWPTLQSAFSTNLVAGSCPAALQLGGPPFVSHRREKRSATGSSSCAPLSSRAPLSKVAWCLLSEAHVEAMPHSSRREGHRAWPFSPLPCLHPWRIWLSKHLWNSTVGGHCSCLLLCFPPWSLLCAHVYTYNEQSHNSISTEGRSHKDDMFSTTLTPIKFLKCQCTSTNNTHNRTNSIKCSPIQRISNKLSQVKYAQPIILQYCPITKHQQETQGLPSNKMPANSSILLALHKYICLTKGPDLGKRSKPRQAKCLKLFPSAKLYRNQIHI